jgi:CIC family chloride channel protein
MVAMGFRGGLPVFPLETNYHFHAAELPFFVILGVCCAGLAWLMTRTLYLCEEFFEDMKIWFPLIPALGGLFVGILGIFYPEAWGTGYAVIAKVLSTPQPMHTLIGIGVAKLAAFAVALGSGASGGTFAPALMIGGSLGAAFGSLVHMVLPNSSAIGIYGMVATAALFGSVYRATPSAILFMLEVTGAYNAFLPVFLVAVVADLAVHYFMRTTINTERLVRRGTLVPDAYTVDPMKLLRVRDLMKADVDTVRSSQRVEEFLTDVMNHGSVPVVDEKGHLVGMLRRSDLLAADPKAKAEDLAQREFPVVYSDEVVHDVALRFVQEELGRSPVLDRQTGELVGILTAFDLLKAKDWEHVQEMSEPARLWGSRRTEGG